MKVGETIDWGDGPHVVELVNACRARVRPVDKVEREINGKTIRATPRSFSISRRTECREVKR